MAGAAGTTGAAQANPGCGGLLQPSCPAPPPPQDQPPAQQPPPPPGQATLTLNTSATGIPLRKRVVLSGKVSGAPEGSQPRVILKASSRAFHKSWHDVARRAGQDGRFRFVVRPGINTIYRVALADGQSVEGQSRSLEVRVYPQLSISFYSRLRHSVKVLFEVQGPEVNDFYPSIEHGQPGTARYGYYYVVPRHSKFAYKLGRGKLKDMGCSITCVRGAWHRVRYTKRVLHSRGILGCIRGTGFLGMGSVYPACGRRVIRVR